MSARDDLLRFLIRYGGACRDCADEDGVCPQTGIGCGERRKAAEFVVGALEYGTKHGYAAGYRLVAPGSLDPETLEAAAKVADGVGDTQPVSGPYANLIASVMGQSGRSIAAAIRALGGEDG